MGGEIVEKEILKMLGGNFVCPCRDLLHTSLRLYSCETWVVYSTLPAILSLPLCVVLIEHQY